MRCSGLQTLHRSVLSMLETSEMVQYIGRGWGVCVFIKNSSICKHQCFSDLMEMQHIMCIVLRGKGEGDLQDLLQPPDLSDAWKLDIFFRRSQSSDQLCIQLLVNSGGREWESDTVPLCLKLNKMSSMKQRCMKQRCMKQRYALMKECKRVRNNL